MLTIKEWPPQPLFDSSCLPSVLLPRILNFELPYPSTRYRGPINHGPSGRECKPWANSTYTADRYPAGGLDDFGGWCFSLSLSLLLLLPPPPLSPSPSPSCSSPVPFLSSANVKVTWVHTEKYCSFSYSHAPGNACRNPCPGQCCNAPAPWYEIIGGRAEKGGGWKRLNCEMQDVVYSGVTCKVKMMLGCNSSGVAFFDN
jgi:hypothetical protein